MARRQAHLRRRLAIGVCLLAVGFAATTARATLRFGPLQISGNLQSQNLVRHVTPSKWQFIQQRNTARLRLDYAALEQGKLLGKYRVPFIRTADLFLLWRGVYDSVYDTTPGVLARDDIHGRAYGGLNVLQFSRERGFGRRPLSLAGIPREGREALRFENQLREAYVDLKFRRIPLHIRAGRQQIVWGETDNFRMLDRINALDLTWHFQQEIPVPGFGWDDLRRPYWMLKFLYQLGNVGPISQSFLEWYWNPGDWYPAKQAFLPRPWGLPLLDPLTNPIDGAFIGGVCDQSPFKVQGGINKGLGRCRGLMNGTKLFQKGDYARNPIENSQAGVRFHGITPQGLEFTLNYFYQRWAGDDGTNSAPLRGVLRTFDPATDLALTDRFLRRGIFPAEYTTPYVHTVGASANYSEEQYTQTIYRLETILDVGVPFFDLAKVTIIDTPALPGITKKNMWKGMIGFDRPTWLKLLNKRSTFLLSGQFFWHYLIDNPGCRAQAVAQLPADERRRAGSCLVGALELPSRERPPNVAFRDKIRDWEALFTLAATSFYRGGSVVPTFGAAVDPVNQWTMELFWAVNWVLRDDLVLNLAQRYFVTPNGRSTPVFETWGLGGLNAGRSESSLRLTYQF